MKSVKNIYIVGKGPSSSHTIGPMRAAKHFRSKVENIDLDKIIVILYGSFALTYIGHGTGKIIEETLEGYNVEFVIDKKTKTEHPNTLKIIAIKNDKELFSYTYQSVGGGVVICLNDDSLSDPDVYPFKDFKEIKEYMAEHNLHRLPELVDAFEGEDIDEYLSNIFDFMIQCVESGLSKEGEIQASKTLWVKRSAKHILENIDERNTRFETQSVRLASYAYAVGEENASGSLVCTAPTCGSSGIIPATLYFLYKDLKVEKSALIQGLKAAGIIGNIFKQNATIAGAVGGCQAEIGVAVCMATSLLCEVSKLSMHQLEYGVELAMEHHLGLTCDPLDGFVVVPCIERNAVGTIRAFESYAFAKSIAPVKQNVISLDEVVLAMKNTGHDIPKKYKETSLGGLAKVKK